MAVMLKYTIHSTANETVKNNAYFELMGNLTDSIDLVISDFEQGLINST